MDHYSYTQLSTYLQCPLKYRYHYLEGWQEMEDKASLIFGRVFQSSVEAQFLVSDSVRFCFDVCAKGTNLEDAALEIVEVPVHYQERIHGVTKMTKVFSNGLRMLRICWHAWNRLDG